MTSAWADELTGSEPRPELEPFYLLAALKLGDPDERTWIERNAPEFYKLWRSWSGRPNQDDGEGAVVLVQYMLWYERDRPKN